MIKLCERVRGPVYPVQTFFNVNQEIDESALIEYIEFLIDHGAKTLMCTIGTSRYDVLTFDEMKKVNEIVVREVDGRAVTIVTGPAFGPTSLTLDFALHSKAIGADAMLAVYPSKINEEKEVLNFFRELSNANVIDILIHEMSIASGASKYTNPYEYSYDLLKNILKLKRVVGMKEESSNIDNSMKICNSFCSENLIIGGRGGMGGFMNMRKYGQCSYLTGVGSFLPFIEEKFYSYILKNDIGKAENIIKYIEMPFFNVAVPMGWHKALKEAMHQILSTPKYERKPLINLGNNEVDKIKSVLTDIKKVDF